MLFYCIYLKINNRSERLLYESEYKKFQPYIDKVLKEKNTFIKEMGSNFTIDLCGDLMNEYWDIKKRLSTKVTNPFINELYKEGLNNGAIGGKIIGSGGGGFLLYFDKKNN